MDTKFPGEKCWHPPRASGEVIAPTNETPQRGLRGYFPPRGGKRAVRERVSRSCARNSSAYWTVFHQSARSCGGSAEAPTSQYRGFGGTCRFGTGRLLRPALYAAGIRQKRGRNLCSVCGVWIDVVEDRCYLVYGVAVVLLRLPCDLATATMHRGESCLADWRVRSASSETVY